MNSLERVKILLRKGEYENAFLLIREIPHEKDDAFNYIYNTCKNSLADQYIYLINEHIKSNNKIAAKEVIEKYVTILGKDKNIDCIITRFQSNDSKSEFALSSFVKSNLLKLICWAALTPFSIEVIKKILSFITYNQGNSILFEAYTSPINTIVYFIFLLTLINELTNSVPHINRMKKIAVVWFFLSLSINMFQYYFAIVNVVFGEWYNYGICFTNNNTLNDYTRFIPFITSIPCILISFLLYILRSNVDQTFFKVISIGMIASLTQTVIGCFIYIFNFDFINELSWLFNLIKEICWYIFLLMLYKTIKKIKNT